MPVTTQVTGSVVEISIEGRFDYNIHQSFRDAFEAEDADSQFLVDLAATAYVDSAGLGMLLVLREYAGGDRATVSLVNCGPELRSLFERANYDRLFSIVDAPQ